MAIRFDETDDYFTLSGGTGKDLPDGDWTIVFLVNRQAVAGGLFQYFFSVGGNPGAADSSNIWFGEDGSAVEDQLLWDVTDTAGNTTGNDALTGLTYDENLGWIVVALGRDPGSNQFETRVVKLGSTVIDDNSTSSDVGFGVTNEDTWHIAQRQDSNADRRFNGDIAYVYKADEFLSDAALIALANGAHPTVVSNNWVVGWDMNEGPGGNTTEPIGGNTATRNSAPITVESPLISKLEPLSVLFTTAAGSDLDIDLAAGSLTLTGYNISTNVEVSTTLSAGSLTLTGYNVSVSLGLDIGLAAGSLTLTGYNASANVEVATTLQAGSLTLTGNNITVDLGSNITLQAGSLTLTGYSATAQVDVSTTLGAGSLTLTGYNSTVEITVPAVAIPGVGFFEPTTLNTGATTGFFQSSTETTGGTTGLFQTPE